MLVNILLTRCGGVTLKPFRPEVIMADNNVSANTAIVVFTGKSSAHILELGGSSSWKLNRSNAKRHKYLVCCRSGIDWVEGPEPHGSAFLIGLISDVVPSIETKNRWLIKISHYAKVDIPDVWKGWRNPVRYTDMESLEIDPEGLEFQPLRDAETGNNNVDNALRLDRLTIAAAKCGLAKTFGVKEEAIEITIRG
jgi:hypothetical protein